MDPLALYGAAVGTLALGLSGYVALRDRARVKFELRFGFATMPMQLGGWTITARVYNFGRRPVTIPPMMYCDMLDGEKMKICLDFSNGSSAVEVGEGQSYVWATPFEQYVHWRKDQHRRKFWVQDALGHRHYAEMPDSLWQAVDDPQRFGYDESKVGERSIKGCVAGPNLSIILYPPGEAKPLL